METKEYTIDGMSCQHCVMAVRKELEKIQGVRVDNVEIGKATVTYEPGYVSDNTIRGAIEEAGYEVKGAA